MCFRALWGLSRGPLRLSWAVLGAFLGASSRSPSEGPQVSGMVAGWEELENARLEWENAPEGAPVHFRVRVLGGKWTRANKSRSAGTISSRASRQEVETWCRNLEDIGVTMKSSYDMELYNLERAAVLARAWCSKMQHFYSITALKDQTPFQLTPAEIGSWVEPGEFAALAEESMHAGQTARAKALRARVANIRVFFW